ncbi:uncharacterized protein [Argopecten irradians]|uniref:uncharacterized protein isoform X2 n=1 Tax=Argopecten irradians TaxID=31199 RepID=UPI0037193F7B
MSPQERGIIRSGMPTQNWQQTYHTCTCMYDNFFTAMVHTGLGGRQINAVLAAVNIPPVSNTLLHARQAESGPAFEDVAEDSIQDSLNKEIQLTTEKSGNSDLTVSVDGAWQKRGSGRSFDSLSGHCSMIGNETGKVVGYSVRSKFCKTCDEATRLQRKPAVHDCRMNWTGSSKAMERDMVVEMLKSHEDAGVHIGTVVADDDTTTFNQIKKINPDISKRSDKNHVKKNIASHLYALQPKHKSLTSKVISYLQKCLNYMICQNQGNAEGICDMLKALGHHPFGNHQFCGSWCLHKSDPSKKYSALPYGRPLNDMNLQESLIALFEKYKLDSEKLSNLASTQANESFNKTVASKAPKSHFYSGSNSLNHRVAASVGQKNVGHSYLVKVHKKIGLSPGTHTTRQAILRDMQARKMKAISTTVKAKKRRLELKLRRTQSNATREIREGRTYASGVAMLVQKIPDECMEIPPPVAPPIPSPCSQLPPSVNPVFFDLESTGLARNSHITQIAGVCGEDMWSTFVIPKIPISTAAANVTGLTLKNGKLFHHGKPVQAVTVSKAIDDLLDFIQRQSAPIYLVGHNIKIFDCPLLFNTLEACGKLSSFLEHSEIRGFIDTKLLFRNAMPGLESYTQENLVKHVTGNEYDAHDASADVVALRDLFMASKISIGDGSLKKATFSVQDAIDTHEHGKRVRTNMPSLQPLISAKVLSVGMARRMAGSNLNIHHVKVAHKRGGTEGVRKVFTETCGKGVRVTKSRKIIDSVSQWMERNQNES